MLAVALDSRDPHHLARADRERDVAHRFEAAVVPGPQPADLEQRSAGRAVCALVERGDRVSDHELGDAPQAHRGHFAGAHHVSLTHHRDAPGEHLHLRQLVGDEHDGGSVRGQLAQHLEELVHLVGRQHRGRLVEDEHARAAVERLQDLDSLLGADRESVEPRARLHGEAVDPGQGRHLALRRRAAEAPERPGRLVSEGDVLRHRERPDQHEMLVHHAQPEPHRVRRALEAHRPAVELHAALVGLEQSVEDAHERGLARPVLSHQGVDLARLEIEGDIPVRRHRAEPAGDAAERDARSLHGRENITRRRRRSNAIGGPSGVSVR